MTASREKTGRWLGTLFALPFAGVGLGMLLMATAPMLYDWVRMHGWHPVQAQLLEARTLVVHDDGSTMYRPVARYRYHFDGRNFEGSRVAIVDRSDNIGDFQEQLGNRLERAMQRGQAVVAWVDPDAPHDAVLDRSLRLPLLAFNMVFVLLFGGFGCGFIWFLWRRRPPAAASSGATAQPWLARPEWADNRIGSDKRLEVYVAWGTSIVWNLVSSPIWYLHAPALLDDPEPGQLIAMIFPIAGIGLLVWAIRVTRDARRHGEVRLQLDPFPGAIGGHVGGSLTLRTPHHAGHRYSVTLSCIRHYRSRSGGDTEWNESLVWQADGAAQPARTAEGTRLSFRFDVPADLPASSEDQGDGEHHGWRVEIDADPHSQPATPPFSRRFPIPVYATGASARFIRQDSEQEGTAQAQRAAEISALATITRDGGGVELYFGYARSIGPALGWLATGAIFGGTGIGAGALGAPLLFPIAFGAVGVSLAGCGVWGLGNSLRVRIDHAGLRTERRFLGITVARHAASRQQLDHLALDVLYRTQQGSRHASTYRVVAVLRDGRRITLATPLRGQSLAEQMMVTLSRDTGLPHAHV